MQKPSIQIINPITVNNWNEYILAFEDYSFFHTSEWAKVLNESYHFVPVYFTYSENDELLAIVPLMLVNSWLTGNRAVSLPFSDFCEPLLKDNSHFYNLSEDIINYSKKEKLKYIEFRSSKNRYPFETEHFRTDFRHILKLDKGETDLLKSFSENTRRNIKKANKEKVTLKLLNNDLGMKIFIDMNCETRKKHGLPPQPNIFFESILKNIINKGYGDIILAVKDETYIAGAIFFKLGKKLLYKFGASYSKYFELRGNHFVMWEAIKKYRAEGYEEFDFGRTEIEHEGLRRFKLGWNTNELSIFTTRYSIEKRKFLPVNLKTEGVHNHILNRSPVFMLKIIGNALYKHVG